MGLRAQPVSEKAGPRRRNRREDAPRSHRRDAEGRNGAQRRPAEEGRRPLGKTRRGSRRNTRHAVDRREESGSKGPLRTATARERHTRSRISDFPREEDTGKEEEAP